MYQIQEHEFVKLLKYPKKNNIGRSGLRVVYELESDFPLIIYNSYDAETLNGCTATINELERLRECKHRLDKYEKLIYILLNYENVGLVEFMSLSEIQLDNFIQNRTDKTIYDEDITLFLKNIEKEEI